jgi:surface-anchored protein
MAPYLFMADAAQSYFGANFPEECEARWTVQYSGLASWVMQTTDPRPGAAVSGQTRDCATDAVAMCMGWLFDVAGTYTVTLTLKGANGESSTAQVTVTVSADTRTLRYVNAAGNDTNGGDIAHPWQHLNFARDLATSESREGVDINRALGCSRPDCRVTR